MHSSLRIPASQLGPRIDLGASWPLPTVASCSPASASSRSIGVDAAAFWEALCTDAAASRPIQAFDARSAHLPASPARSIGFDAKKYIDKEERKSSALMAAHHPAGRRRRPAGPGRRQGGQGTARPDPLRRRVRRRLDPLASSTSWAGHRRSAPDSNARARRSGDVGRARGWTNIQPLWMLKYLPNMLACHVSILHNAQGPNNTITESDVAGLLALGEAFRIIRRDQADFFLVGGGRQQDQPAEHGPPVLFQPAVAAATTSRRRRAGPFDRAATAGHRRGGGVLVVGGLEHARRRGAPIYGEVVGFGAAFDRGLTGKGLARAIRAASPRPASTRQTSTTSTPTAWARSSSTPGKRAASDEVLRRRRSPVGRGAKSYIGNLGAGSGIDGTGRQPARPEARQLPPTLNYESPTRPARCTC